MESSSLPIVVAIVLPNLFGWFEGFFIRDASKNWYPKLKTPPWDPPGWFVGLLWNFLYAAMGYGSYLVWREGQLSTSTEVQEQVRCALWMYAFQVFITWMWVPLFFHLRNVGLALLDFVLILVLAPITMYEFYLVNHFAAYLFLPYLAWGSFAITVNYYIWKHTPSDVDNSKKK